MEPAAKRWSVAGRLISALTMAFSWPKSDSIYFIPFFRLVIGRICYSHTWYRAAVIQYFRQPAGSGVALTKCSFQMCFVFDSCSPLSSGKCTTSESGNKNARVRYITHGGTCVVPSTIIQNAVTRIWCLEVKVGRWRWRTSEWWCGELLPRQIYKQSLSECSRHARQRTMVCLTNMWVHFMRYDTCMFFQ